MNANADKKGQEGGVGPKKAGGIGLGGMKLSGLLKSQAEAVADSALKELPLDVIDEDANQPRLEDNPGFRPEMIAEIGGTIKARGVKQPISVRENLDAPGRYIINDGARRYRGSKWAGKATIWSIVDNDFVPDDQVVANIQREGHTAREIAKLIAQRIASGMKKGEIAKRWGKSPAYITQHAALLDLPAAIAQAYDSGRIADVTLVNELVTAHKSKPQEVADWLADVNQEITRGSVKLLREFLEEGVKRDPDTVDAFNGETDAEGEAQPPKKKSETKEEDPTKLKKAIVQVEINGDLCRLILNKRPSEGEVAWFKNEVSGEEFEASLASAKLVALVEG
jgi:ParB family chromosome partitioning protein